MKRIRKTHKKDIHRCDNKTQWLKDSIRGSVSADYLGYALEKIEQLPQLNKEVIFIKNKKGILVEVVGKVGASIQYGVICNNAVWYFDGNKVGKRKQKILNAFYNQSISLKNEDDNKVTKLWQKLQRQGRV